MHVTEAEVSVWMGHHVGTCFLFFGVWDGEARRRDEEKEEKEKGGEGRGREEGRADSKESRATNVAGDSASGRLAPHQSK